MSLLDANEQDTGILPVLPYGPGDEPSRSVAPDDHALRVLMSMAAPEAAISSAVLPDSATWANGPVSTSAGQANKQSGKFRSLPYPLLAVLAVQAFLSLHLVWSNTASTDEALYLWAGRLEWTHWLHGTAVPLFPTYFSGAPVVYPPLGTLADAIGGLAGARILSLCFMLAATALLWSTAARLYGRQAGFFAIALWAFLGPTLRLGAYATYDAMSLFLIMLAAWCVTARRTREEATGWIVAAAGALALANAAKYASAIFDPVVILLAVLTSWPMPGGKAAFRRGALLTTCGFGILYLAIRFAGTYYATGVEQTTLSRVTGPDAPSSVLVHSGAWIGAVVGLACFGTILSVIRSRERSSTLLLAVLTGAALLAPTEQARIHTLTSLDKHTDFGAWFAAIAAGYAVDRLVMLLRPMLLRAAAMALAGSAVAIVAFMGFGQAQAMFASWPNAKGFVDALRPVVAASRGPLLVEVSPLGEYYLPSGSQWARWSNTYSIQLLSGGTAGYSPGAVNTAGNPAAYARFIAHGYFSIVALNFGATPDLDSDIEADLKRTPGYHVIGWSTYGGNQYPIWAYQGAR